MCPATKLKILFERQSDKDGESSFHLLVQEPWTPPSLQREWKGPRTWVIIHCLSGALAESWTSSAGAGSWSEDPIPPSNITSGGLISHGPRLPSWHFLFSWPLLVYVILVLLWLLLPTSLPFLIFYLLVENYLRLHPKLNPVLPSLLPLYLLLKTYQYLVTHLTKSKILFLAPIAEMLNLYLINSLIPVLNS